MLFRNPKALALLSFIVLLFAAFVYQFKPTPYPFPFLRNFPPMPQSSSNPVTVEGAALGRYLFYDTILSSNHTVSCATCHMQQYAFSDAGHQFSKGINGMLQQRNTPPLFNLAWYDALFWDGRAESAEAQVFHPVRTTSEMNLDWSTAAKRIGESHFYKEKFSMAFPGSVIDSVTISKAIAQFLRTIISYRSKFDRAIAGKAVFTEDEYRGFILANEMTLGGCLHCHTVDENALGTTGGFSNNGLDKARQNADFKDAGQGGVTGNKNDYGKFKIPSLRNVALTAPYMHDGRFATLEEVVDFYSTGVNQSLNIDSKMEKAHVGGVHFSPEQKKQLIAFLHTLTDSALVTDPEFSNPFIR